MKYKDILGYSEPKKKLIKEKVEKPTLTEELEKQFGKLDEAGFQSKDGKAAIRQYKRIYDRNVKGGEKYYASSVDQLADFMEQQGLGNQAQMLRGEYMRVVQKWQDKWLKQFVKSLK